MLGIMKAHLVGATRGHALLKKKKVMKTSSFALTEAKCIACKNIKHIVLENVQTASLKFEYFTEGETKNNLIRLARGGQQVLVKLASLQTSFLTLDNAIKTTNCRVNALENVVKPRLENTITYINGELDELEMEDFFKLKKIQGYKKREIERQLAASKQYAPMQRSILPRKFLCRKGF
ncbi:hypothetical protein CsSME_00053504 [Camellia sinensis var. sinensis]